MEEVLRAEMKRGNTFKTHGDMVGYRSESSHDSRRSPSAAAKKTDRQGGSDVTHCYPQSTALLYIQSWLVSHTGKTMWVKYAMKLFWFSLKKSKENTKVIISMCC